MQRELLNELETAHAALISQMFASTGEEYHRLYAAKCESWKRIAELTNELKGAK